ncbi:MAG TPA: Mur ligase family protein [Patescibacteria group bacterium]|nr:Mur ligase family protein [Patescibacteria group bacterium]
MTKMTFNQAYNFVLSLGNLPRLEYMRDPRHTGTYLKRIQFFLDMIGNPEKKIPHYIHVTGTSGKGSVTAYLHSILKASGQKAGATFSPHPTYINERWKIGDHYMTKQEFVDLVTFLKPKLDQYIRLTPYDMLSFFELTEVLGLLWFARNKVKWAIMEVACGGRYDATNIIPRKDVAVITNVGVDHIGIIGNNKREIAYEKAGIIKPRCAVFTSERDKNIRAIFEKECRKNKVKMNVFNAPKFKLLASNFSETTFLYNNEKYSLPMFGAHQIKNAILCIEIAKHLKLKYQDIFQGLKKVDQPLRLEIVGHNPLAILDAAHNPDKIKTTVAAIKQLKDIKNIYLILGSSENKNTRLMMKHLASLKPKVVYCSRNTMNPFRKVLNPQTMAKELKQLLPNTPTPIYLDPLEAWKVARDRAKKDDLILVTGSIFISGELRGQLVKNTP